MENIKAPSPRQVLQEVIEEFTDACVHGLTPWKTLDVTNKLTWIRDELDKAYEPLVVNVPSHVEPEVAKRLSIGRAATLEAPMGYSDRAEFERLKAADVAQGKRIAELLEEVVLWKNTAETRLGLLGSTHRILDAAGVARALTLPERIKELVRDRDDYRYRSMQEDERLVAERDRARTERDAYHEALEIEAYASMQYAKERDDLRKDRDEWKQALIDLRKANNTCTGTLVHGEYTHCPAHDGGGK